MLVEEMTRHHENLVVILAGYEREMDGLLNSNPGLRSRFKKHIHFPSYSQEELVQLLLYLANQRGYELTEEAKAS